MAERRSTETMQHIRKFVTENSRRSSDQNEKEGLPGVCVKYVTFFVLRFLLLRVRFRFKVRILMVRMNADSVVFSSSWMRKCTRGRSLISEARDFTAKVWTSQLCLRRFLEPCRHFLSVGFVCHSHEVVVGWFWIRCVRLRVWTRASRPFCSHRHVACWKGWSLFRSG